MGTLKPQSKEPLYSNMVTGTLAVDGWAVTFGTVRRGLGGLRLSSPLQAVPNVTATHQRPVYQLHIIRCITTITFAL